MEITQMCIWIRSWPKRLSMWRWWAPAWPTWWGEYVHFALSLSLSTEQRPSQCRALFLKRPSHKSNPLRRQSAVSLAKSETRKLLRFLRWAQQEATHRVCCDDQIWTHYICWTPKRLKHLATHFKNMCFLSCHQPTQTLFSLRGFFLTYKFAENMAWGLMGVFHHDLQWAALSRLHKNRGSALNLDNAAGLFPLSTCLKSPNVGENTSTLSVWSISFCTIRHQRRILRSQKSQPYLYTFGCVNDSRLLLLQ